jgi:hypothetical protein
MRRFVPDKILPVVAGGAAVLAGLMPAYAGLAVPAPVAGLAGPYGLLAVGLVYGGYRLVKHLRKRP